MSKPPMPEALVPLAEAALARHRRRRFVPDVAQSQDGWDCPYSDADADRWWALLFDVFGTRSTATVVMFFDQLAGLMESHWDETWKQWVIDGDRMVAFLTMIQAMRPRDEAQAALAAQLVGLHVNAMKLAEGAARYSGGDGRSVATLAKAVRAYGDGLVIMRKLQGKGGSSKQSIKVEKRVYYQQLNISGGGSEIGGQPLAKPTIELIEASAAVPGKDPDGQIVPFPESKRENDLPKP